MFIAGALFSNASFVDLFFSNQIVFKDTAGQPNTDFAGNALASYSYTLVQVNLENYTGSLGPFCTTGDWKYGLTTIVNEWSVRFQTLLAAISRPMLVNTLRRYSFSRDSSRFSDSR